MHCNTDRVIKKERIGSLKLLSHNPQLPTGDYLSRRYLSTRGNAMCCKSNSSRFDDISLLPQLRSASGASHTLETSNALLLSRDTGCRPPYAQTRALRADASRANPVITREDVMEGEDEEDSEILSTLSSAYVRHHRYENPFTAYQPVSDPYDRHREIERQQRFINENKRLGRPFIPSGGRALEKPTRYLLGDCVAALYRTIARDWAETDPMVISTAEDLVVVYMKRERVRNTTTVLRYMNASLKRNEAVRLYDLKKIPEGWDVLTEDGHMMYTFKPPWVRQRRFLPDQVVVRKIH